MKIIYQIKALLTRNTPTLPEMTPTWPRIPANRFRVAPDDKNNQRYTLATRAMDEVRADNAIIQNAQQRFYTAGQPNRSTGAWLGSQATGNEEVRRALYRLRARSRDLAQNNDWMKKIISLYVNNVVGPNGFAAKWPVRADNGDILTTESKRIRDAWYRWGDNTHCDISGRFTLNGLQRAAEACWVRDGEVLVRIIRGTPEETGNPYGIALQLLETDRLDINRNSFEQQTGNRCIMGIETNKWGRPVAYWLFDEVEPVFSGSMQAGFQSKRVPAEEIIHCYDMDRPEMLRGVPKTHSSMTALYMLGQIEEAHLVAARAGASRMGFIQATDGNIAPVADGVDEQGNFYEDFAPGKIGVLPVGYTYTEAAGNKYPEQGFTPFVTYLLRSVASALSIPYHSLANSLEGVSFSSIRSGELETRDQWKTEQSKFIDQFLKKLAPIWLESALLNNAITYAPGGRALSIADYERYNCAVFTGRRWDWVDPLRDQQAKIVAVDNGLESRTSVLNEMGRDIDDVWHELKQEQDDAQTLGISVSMKPAPAAEGGAGEE